MPACISHRLSKAASEIKRKWRPLLSPYAACGQYSYAHNQSEMFHKYLRSGFCMSRPSVDGKQCRADCRQCKPFHTPTRKIPADGLLEACLLVVVLGRYGQVALCACFINDFG